MTQAKQNLPSNQETLHVLQIASGDLWAGAEVMLSTLGQALNDRHDVNVSAIILNYGELEKKLRDYGISVYVLDESKLNSFQIFWQMNKLIHKLNPDIVHTHRNKENFLGSLAAKIKYNKPSLRTVHGAPEHRPPMHKLAKQFIRLLDWTSGRFIQKRIVAVSADLAEKLKYSFPESKIETIENGIDIDAVTSHLNQTKINDNNRHKIGIIGRLTPVKRIDLFINSAVFIKQQQPELPIDFYIFGDGPLHNSLKAQIKSLHAENYIHFEGHCEQIPQALQTLDALLMTSDHEGLPMVLLEAMCVQTPIIAHAVGGIPHLLKQGKCGALISEHTAEAFAYAILDLIQQPEKYQALAEQALSHVKQKYSNKHTASAYLNLYKELAQR